MTPIVGDAIEGLLKNTLGKVVDKLAEKYLPASMSEKEKEEFRLKAAELVLEEYKTTMAANAEINATMREEAKSEHWMQWSWRPLVGFTFAGVIINNYILIPYGKVIGLGIQPLDIPSELWGAMLVVLGVAAGTRGIEKWQREKR